MSDSENQGAGEDLIFLYGRVARERDELRDAFRETAALYNEKTDRVVALEATITTLKAELAEAQSHAVDGWRRQRDEITTLKAQLEAAEGKAALADEAREEVILDLAAGGYSSVPLKSKERRARDWLKHYDALSVPASDTGSEEGKG